MTRPIRLATILTLVLGMAGMQLAARPAVAATTITVSTCDQSHLDAAVQQANNDNAGDTITFSCSGTITLSSTLTINGSMTIDGSGQSVILDGGGSVQLMTVNSGVGLTLSHLTLQHGNGTGTGGIDNNGSLTITASTLAGNDGSGGETLEGSGGAIDNHGYLSISASTLSGNRSNGGFGGAIDNQGTLSIIDSTLSGNVIDQHPNDSSGYGGAIYNGGTLIIIASTLAGNVNFAFEGSGGAIDNGYVLASGTATIIASTISGNGDIGSDGGGIANLKGTVTFAGSIVANNNDGNCSPGVYGGITDAGYNLESSTDCGFTGSGSLQNTNPNLGSLANNGGPTQTMALLSGSPASDHIPAGTSGAGVTLCPASGTIDQRGDPRPDGGETTCDVGAFEAQGVAGPPPTLAVSPSHGAPFQTLTLTGTNFGANESVTVRWNGTTTLTTTTTSAADSFTATVKVPQAAFGRYALKATGLSSGLSASAPFTVTPALILSPTHGKAGSVVNVLGVGFAISETVAALWYPGFKVLKSGHSNAVGTVSLTITIPMSPTGAYYVIGYGVNSKQHAIAPFQVTARGGASFQAPPGTAWPLSGETHSVTGALLARYLGHGMGRHGPLRLARRKAGQPAHDDMTDDRAGAGDGRASW